MMIAPVIFCTVVHGIGSMRDLKKVGRVGVKTLFYFEAVSTLALVIGLVVGKLLQPGKGFDIVISRWEGELDAAQLKAALTHPVALGEELERQPV
jgi:Na+/H+-dicarboxylate symporter